MFTKQEEQVAYEAPQVEVIEVEVEQGFVQSDPASMPNGGNPFQ
jgi:hypothetical protein